MTPISPLDPTHGTAPTHTTDPSLLEPGWREAFHEVNGVRLHVVEAGDPADPVLILLHGFPEFWWTWHRQITALAAAGYHVVVPDQRGYNTSDVPKGVRSYALDTLASDVLALADAYGADRFHLVAHDWGAVIAWRVAARAPERVLHLVPMAGPHPDVWLREVLTHPRQVLRSAYVGFFQLPRVPERVLGASRFRGLRAMMARTGRGDTFAPGELDRYAEAWAHPGSLTGMLHYYRALRHRTPSPGRIVPPTLVIWAEHDVALGRGLAEASVKRCTDGRLLVIPGTSHWLQLEEPERLVREIVSFLREPHRGE